MYLHIINIALDGLKDKDGAALLYGQVMTAQDAVSVGPSSAHCVLAADDLNANVLNVLGTLGEDDRAVRAVELVAALSGRWAEADILLSLEKLVKDAHVFTSSDGGWRLSS